jgi:hypothetical protein
MTLGREVQLHVGITTSLVIEMPLIPRHQPRHLTEDRTDQKNYSQVWQRPIPICGSIYSKIILTASLSYFVGILNHHIEFGGIIPGLIFLAIGGGLLTFELSAIKKMRNNAADELYRVLAEKLKTKQKLTTDYSVYLRRFGAEDKEPSLGLPPIHPSIIDRQMLPNTFESFLSDQMYGWCSLVGLGRLEETVGVGKILGPDPEWQDRVRTLFQDARIIF